MTAPLAPIPSAAELEGLPLPDYVEDDHLPFDMALALLSESTDMAVYSGAGSANVAFTAQQATAALRSLSEDNARLRVALTDTKSRVQTWPIDDHETCMCGSTVESHSNGSGHSPVTQGDHAVSEIVKAIDAALEPKS